MSTEVKRLFNRENIEVYINRPRSMDDILHKSVTEYGQKEAVRLEEDSLSYKELEEKSFLLASILYHEYQIKKGDRIGVIAGNVLAFPLLVFAAAKLGAIMVPINVKLKAKEMEYILQDSSPSLLITEKNYHTTIKSEITLLEKMDVFSFESVEDLIPQRSLPSKTNFPNIEEEDPLFLIYTSGTTGRPKGAVLSHVGVIHNLMNYHQTLKTDSNMKTIIAVPLFHVTGLIGQLLHMVYAGGTSIILNNYQNEKYIEEIQKHKVDFLFNVPSIFMMMRTSPLFDKYTFDFVKKVAYGGSPIYKETLEMLREAFPNASFHNAYGATETSSPATIMPLEYPLSKASSVGLPVTGAEILIIDQLNNECKPGEEGEVLIKGPMVIEKYWQNQKANDTSFENGYWKSGDIGMKDNDGFIYILDRKKDMINRAGEKVFSIEVEDVLKAHPDILDAAVIGVPDSILGEKVKAFLVSSGPNKLQNETIQEYCRSQLAKFKVPEDIEWVKELPRNASGKILKQNLKTKENSTI